MRHYSMPMGQAIQIQNGRFLISRLGISIKSMARLDREHVKNLTIC
jgi:hypothetical protein